MASYSESIDSVAARVGFSSPHASKLYTLQKLRLTKPVWSISYNVSSCCNPRRRRRAQYSLSSQHPAQVFTHFFVLISIIIYPLLEIHFHSTTTYTTSFDSTVVHKLPQREGISNVCISSLILRTRT